MSDTYRRAILEVSADLLIGLFQRGGPFVIHGKALPEDAHAVGAEYDACRDVWRIAVESDEFHEVQRYELLPVLDLEARA